MDRELNNNSSMEISLYIEKIEAFFILCFLTNDRQQEKPVCLVCGKQKFVNNIQMSCTAHKILKSISQMNLGDVTDLKKRGKNE